MKKPKNKIESKAGNVIFGSMIFWLKMTLNRSVTMIQPTSKHTVFFGYSHAVFLPKNTCQNLLLADRDTRERGPILVQLYKNSLIFRPNSAPF